LGPAWPGKTRASKAGLLRSPAGMPVKAMRPGGSISMRSPICTTSPPASDSTRASSTMVGTGLGVGADDLHGLAERGLQEAPGRQEVGHQALLDDAQAGRAQQHGFRLHLAADILDGQQCLAGRQVDAARLADQAEILVVDR
jgi:hypothetical protein